MHCPPASSCPTLLLRPSPLRNSLCSDDGGWVRGSRLSPRPPVAKPFCAISQARCSASTSPHFFAMADLAKYLAKVDYPILGGKCLPIVGERYDHSREQARSPAYSKTDLLESTTEEREKENERENHREMESKTWHSQRLSSEQEPRDKSESE
eukprot:6184942-Pleurochrysis_carterae.AAC.5